MLRNITLTCALTVIGLTCTGVSSVQAQFVSPIPPVIDSHYCVHFRQVHWRDRSFDCPKRAEKFACMLRRRGFQASVEPHGCHYHVHFRMLNWNLYRTVDCPREAHYLEGMLMHNGFQARVIHH